MARIPQVELSLPALGKSSAAELDQQVRAVLPAILLIPTPKTGTGTPLLWRACGKQDLAVRLLKSAIAGRYCAYNALQTDPLLVSLRGTPDFAPLLSAAKECQDQFLSDRVEASH